MAGPLPRPRRAEPQPDLWHQGRGPAVPRRHQRRHAPPAGGSTPAAGRVTLAEWAATYLATVTNLRPTTLATYERDLTLYVLPRFGQLPLSRIRPLDVRSWLADELVAGIAPTSVHRHFCTLRRLLRVAVESDLLVKSPCAGIKPPPVEPVEMRFLTAAEVHRLAEEMHPHFRVLVYTAAYAGLRWGELIGLKRGRVDIANQTITVSSSSSR